MSIGCATCNKWESLGGGLCGICRTLDRLCALVRGADYPVGAGTETLLRLRSWTAELIDLSEALRGVAPDPAGVAAPGPRVGARVLHLAQGPPGAFGKAAGPRPPEEIERQLPPQREKTRVKKDRSPEVKEESTPEETPRRKKKRRRSSSSSRRARKKSKKSRSPGSKKSLA